MKIHPTYHSPMHGGRVCRICPQEEHTLMMSTPLVAGTPGMDIVQSAVRRTVWRKAG